MRLFAWGLGIRPNPQERASVPLRGGFARAAPWKSGLEVVGEQAYWRNGPFLETPAK